MYGSGFNPYGTGNRVYRGGSSAAHMGGGLDPMGYINRELNNKASQQRSGFAQAALARLQGFGSGGANVGAGGIKTNKPKRPKPKPKPGVTTPGPDGAGVIEDDNLTAVQTPVISSPTGKLSLNPDLLEETADYEYEYNKTLNDINAERTRVNNEYTIGHRDLGQQQVLDQRGDLNRYAARNMAFSSGYGDEVANSATMFTNAFSDLATQKTNALNALDQQKLSADSWKTNVMRLLAERQAARNAENAGTLGLDPNFVPPAQTPMPKPQTPKNYSVPAKAKVTSKNKNKDKNKGKGKGK